MKATPSPLSRREREIMDVVYAMQEASASQIHAQLVDPPANAAVRNHLRILEDKGHLKRRKDGKKFLYKPTVSRLKTGRSAIGRVINVYFGDSLQSAVAAHMADPSSNVSEQELQALEELIQAARGKKAGTQKAKSTKQGRRK